MFDRQIEESIEIVATPSEIWWQLTSFESYPEWNPFITRIEGEPAEGSVLEVKLEPPGMLPVVVRPKVLRSEPERELRWVGQLGVSNIFDGEHVFIIESIGVDHCRFIQRENFDGLLVPAGLAFMGRSVRRGFQQMNQALCQRAEAAHASREVARGEDEARGRDSDQ